MSTSVSAKADLWNEDEEGEELTESWLKKERRVRNRYLYLRVQPVITA